MRGPILTRELTEADLGMLTRGGNDGRPATTGTPLLKKVREVHHAAARLLAAGVKNAEVAAATGLCVSRVAILKDDPTFRELLAFYTEREDERFQDVQDRMKILGLTAADVLQDRLVETPDEFASRDLTELMKAALDRGGAPAELRVTARAEGDAAWAAVKEKWGAHKADGNEPG